MSLYVFHDEREIKNKWLYHGILIISEEEYLTIADALHKLRDKYNWSKELKFKNLETTTIENEVAQKWVEFAVEEIVNSQMWFHFLGVDYSNLDKEIWQSKRTRDFRIYNRFFQIALYGAIKWFFKDYKECKIKECKIQQIFSDKRNLRFGDPFLTQPIREIERKTSAEEFKIMFVNRRITLVDSNHLLEQNYPKASNLIQLVDLLTGGLSQIYDYTSNHRGKCEVAELLLRKRLPQEAMGYDEHFKGQYCRKCRVSFFPKKRLGRNAILNRDISFFVNQFYNNRELKYFLEKYQPKLL